MALSPALFFRLDEPNLGSWRSRCANSFHFKINFIYSLFSGVFFKENNKHRRCFQTTMIISAVDAAPTASGTYGRQKKKKKVGETEPEYSWNTMDVATGE